MSHLNDPKVLIALDFDDEEAALNFVNQLSPQDCRLKVGKEMFTYFGPEFVKKLIAKDFDVFLDLKFHDIPNTVAKAVVAAAKMGVWMVNVHASGGPEMMIKAKEALLPFGEKAPLLIAVTVLTSMDADELSRLGVTKSPQEQVLYLATLAKQSGLDGVVCSAQEASSLKDKFGKNFKLITPGIRPQGSEIGDQKRIMTPKLALENGSDYLVIGRPITQAEDPVAALAAINLSL
ncbi:orotidine-5'-phosphate decarboxylase [Pseudoalteromonas tunicata]|uniref:Orotidine 5'-phosphate decarboxylase n=1 Tax=Pseudoalteromonas tunicata D2 TaxID=87626 RepID=A4C9P3_9GAMM|nr:orotidine-5'-phosphate decarboxylase [Pseudoalteromonas tunicata]ATC94646.1 orotidine-5'-phosphate decarboxylase [Pseudoalteromonas tunicata]AXT30367.1 orotidine-5'-phosphate decarboxylase [Pseudoalteromonas tunicata]EAR28101.1 orotidine-5'-phosphate decarboxylase [Pseudoalteromonas tunicata D2]